MKVLIINGSPHPEGNTAIGLREVEKELNKAGIETEFVTIGNKDIRGCIACDYCRTHGCAFLKMRSMSLRQSLKRPMAY